MFPEHAMEHADRGYLHRLPLLAHPHQERVRLLVARHRRPGRAVRVPARRAAERRQAHRGDAERTGQGEGHGRRIRLGEWSGLT